MSATTNSVQRAHEDLHAGGAPKDDCPICVPLADSIEKAGEETPVTAAEDKVYTEAVHFQLLTSAVERETAKVTSEKAELDEQVSTLTTEKAELESANTDLQNKVDVLEAEKSAETTRADTAEQELENFRAELAELAAIESRREERVAAIKAADASLGEDYFDTTRVQRWAEMADDKFAELLSDVTAAAAARPATTETTETEATTETARETAAFTGGTTATTSGTTLGSFLTATGKLPAAS